MASNMTIDSFDGPYRFLSNFYPCQIEYCGNYYPTTEHAFQAMKATNVFDEYMIRCALTPGQAKRLGRKIKIKPTWDRARDIFMREILEKKFAIPAMREALLATGDAELIEGNTWGDTYWGVCEGVGENKLGKMLMEIRQNARTQSAGRNCQGWV